MTTLFLLLSLLGALIAWNVHRPIVTQPHGAVLSFLNGWLVGELALHVIALQALGTLVFVGLGAVTGWQGVLGLGLSILSWIGLAVAYQRAEATDLHFELALREGLGQDYRTAIQPEFLGMLDRPLTRRRLLLPHEGLRSPEVDTFKNIVYHQVDGLRLKLDIRHRRDRPTGAPVLLQIHGGAWTWRMGSKNEQGLPLMVHLAEQGWVCVSIDYRLSPRATFPEHLIDCKRALVWVKRHIAEYGGDPDQIVVTGGSAGGHLSALMAVTANRSEFQPGFELADTSVQGCISFYGIYDFLDEHGLQTHRGLHDLLERSVMKVSKREAPDQYRLASPLHHIHPDVCPFLLIQGDRDSLVSPRESRWFAARLRAVSRQPVVYVELPGAQHAFDVFPSLRSDLTLRGIDRFLAWWRSHEARERGG